MNRLWATFLILLSLAVSCASAEDPLASTAWALAQMGPVSDLQEVSLDPPLTIEFLDDGRMKGSTGCNSYAGEYDIRGTSSLAVAFQITEAGCSTQAMFWREHEFKSILPVADMFVFEGSRLTIATQDGQRLVFTR